MMRWVLGVVALAACGTVAQEVDAPGPPDAILADGPVVDATRPDAMPPGSKRVFVTSVRRNGNFGGLDGADQHCSQMAQQASLSGTYLAWMSASNLGPSDRMTHHPGPYVVIDGRVVANSWADLTDGQLASPIDQTEQGTPAPSVQCNGLGGRVWTATRSNGAVNPAIENCQDWSSNNGPGAVGTFLGLDGSWSDDLGATCGCSNPLPLYCFEQ